MLLGNNFFQTKYYEHRWLLQHPCLIWKAADVGFVCYLFVVAFFLSKLQADTEKQHFRGSRLVFRDRFSID